MVKKHKKNQENKVQSETRQNFKLHTDAIDVLVNANEDNVEPVSDEEIKSYKRDKLALIPTWLKALFIKFWFNGAVCLFIIWGLGYYIPNSFDLLFVAAIAMGIITDLLVNSILRFFDDGSETYTKWALIPQKALWTFFVNILYSMVIMFLVMIAFNGTNIIINKIAGNADGTTVLRVEPILFGLTYLVIDLVFVGIKSFIVRLIKDANKKLDEQANNKNGK